MLDTKRMIHRILTLAIALAGGSITAPINAATSEPGTLQINGSIQMWKRSCPEPSRCSLPTAIGNVKTIAGNIDAPKPGLGTSFYQTAEITQDAPGMAESWLVTVQVFRKTKSNVEDSSYTAYQVTVAAKSTGRIVSLCSSYEPEIASGDFFPVGACGGESPGSEGQEMIGVTFRRTQLP